jgi:hypothetical protein
VIRPDWLQLVLERPIADGAESASRLRGRPRGACSVTV